MAIAFIYRLQMLTYGLRCEEGVCLLHQTIGPQEREREVVKYYSKIAQ